MTDQTAYGPTPSVSTGRFQAIYDKSYHTIDYTNSTGTDIADGQVVVVGTIPMVAIAGIANVSVGCFQTPTSTGSLAVTGVGFKPDTLLFCGVGNSNAPPNVSAGDFLSLLSFIASGAQGASSLRATNGTRSSASYQRAHPIAEPQASAGAAFQQAICSG